MSDGKSQRKSLIYPHNTPYSAEEPRIIKLPGHRLRSLATRLYNLQPPVTRSKESSNSITIVCISDTHTTRPELPPGDLLLHGGDLSENGSFTEIQTQLKWLSSQPHRHKVVIAGNHDILFDPLFLESNPWRKQNNEPGKTAKDLDFGSVIYLQDEAKALRFSRQDGEERQLTIYGSPVTPAYGNSGFQVPRNEDFWKGKISDRTDILLTHGPPWRHLDGGLHAGSISLAKEVARARPRLVVFGHIHAGYGQEDVRFNRVTRAYESVLGEWEGWTTLMGMALWVLWARFASTLLPARLQNENEDRVTTLVNAAVLGGRKNQYRNAPIVVQI